MTNNVAHQQLIEKHREPLQAWNAARTAENLRSQAEETHLRRWAKRLDADRERDGVELAELE
jgi:hypothetical protein